MCFLARKSLRLSALICRSRPTAQTMHVLCGEDEAKVQTFLITTKDLKKKVGGNGNLSFSCRSIMVGYWAIGHIIGEGKNKMA